MSESKEERGYIDDPLQRQGSPLLFGERPASPGLSEAPNVTFLDSTTPRKSKARAKGPSASPSISSSSSRSPQPLIQLSSDEEESGGKDKVGRRADMSGSKRSYGTLAQPNEDDDSRQMHRKNTPGRIRLPSAPYSRSAAGDETVSDTSMLTPSGYSITSGIPRPRKLSFKKRRLGPNGSPGTDGHLRKGFLNRASMGVFGRAPSISASSAAGGDARARARQLRQTQTLSVHPGDQGGDNASSWERKPKIPSILPSAQPSPYSTPIPTVPFVVLCLVCFGEFSSAGVAGPFLFFQIDSFNVGGEKEVAKWAGIVSAVFFFAQFLTSLLWASAAQKHGRRAVLLVSLIGNAVSLVVFGMSTNIKMAISVRLAQGLFNGAVGVAKGAVRDLTDETNEGRAMGQLGFAWGMGGIVGPLLGGVLCNPVDKYPWLFGDSVRFKQYPYLLPCLVVASFTATGAFLSLFIGYDGGPRTGAIHLPEKVDVERVTAKAASNMGSLSRSAGKTISGYFGNGAENAGANDSIVSLTQTNNPHTRRGSSTGGNAMSRTFTQQVDDETGGPPSPMASDDGTVITTRAGQSGFDAQSILSRTRARQRNILNDGGSAYGYGNLDAGPSRYRDDGSRERPASYVQQQSQQNRRGLSNLRHSIVSQSQYAPDFEEMPEEKEQKLSFAQRFLLANDDAVLGLSDLWVAAAINGDEGYEDQDDDFGYDYIDEEDEEAEGEIDEEEEQETLDDSVEDDSDVNESTGSRVFGHDDVDEDSPLVPRHLPPVNFARKNRQYSLASSNVSRPFAMRSGLRVPSLYNNTGVEYNPLLSPGLSSGPTTNTTRPDGPAQGYDPTLAGIPESGSLPGSLRGKKGPNIADDASNLTLRRNDAQVVQQKSLLWQLPLVFIAHYSLMSLHSSTFDQIFMAFLVTPVESGGLGLTAAHYAELIAAMAFCQIGFQFYFYPKVGPPQGKFSHLAMMRLGTSLYLGYILFAFLRAFLHPSTDAIVMTFMILFASVRWLANVCAFTSVSVLMNATTAPHLIALANGLAQTTSSAARFIGPLIGGEQYSSRYHPQCSLY